MRKKAFAIALAALMLCSCGAKGDRAKKKDLPGDRSYNRYIMETDKGYYTYNLGGYGQGMALRFYERDSDNQIFLCAKPECRHDGSERCTATYKGLACRGAIVYDGAIYVLLMDDSDIVTLSVYKVALDGTSLTKVGDVFSTANSSEEEGVTNNGGGMIIHKGCAYISYHITFGSSQFGFAGSGLTKMDLSNGKTEEIWSGEKYFDQYPQDMYGNDDYVYYSNLSQNDNRGFYRYDINLGETKKLWDWEFPVAGDNKFFFRDFDKERMVNQISTCGKTDADIEKANNEGFDVIIDDIGNDQYLIPYEDKLIIEDDGKVQIYSDSGEKLGELPFLDEIPEGKYEYSDPFFLIDVSDGKVYFDDPWFEREHDKYVIDNPDGSFQLPIYDRVVYCCPIDDIIAGTGEWKLAYGEKDIFTSGLMSGFPGDE